MKRFIHRAAAASMLGLAFWIAGCRDRAEVPDDFALDWGLSTNVLRVGDPVELTLRVAHPASARIEWPVLARDRAVVIRDQSTDSRPLDGDRVMTRARFLLTSLELGRHTVSTGLVAFILADGTRRETPFPAAEFTVESSLSGPEETLRDIKGLARWPAAWPRWPFVLAAVAALAAILGWLTARLLNKPRTILHYPPPLPPHEIALRALRALKEKGLIERGEVEPFYVELSAIVRRYIEDRFGLRAPEQTTEEFIRDASSSGRLRPDHQELVRGFLEHSDLVKFARFRPGPDQMRSAFAAAERLVQETRPPVQEAPS